MDEELILVKKEKKPKSKLSLIICIVLVILLLGGGGYYYYKNYYNKEEKPTEQKKEERANLKDDFYAYVNYQSDAQPMNDANTAANNNKNELGKSIEDAKEYKDENYYKYFELFEDFDGREKRDLDELKPYFDEIDNADTLDKFSDIMIKVDYDLGVKSFLNYGISQDFYNNSRNVILFGPMQLEKMRTFTFDPTSKDGLEYFTNSDYEKYKQAFESGRIELFKRYGYDETKATKLSNEITEFAKVIQAKSQSINEINGNYIKHYKNVTKAELKSLASNLPIDKLLAKFNVSDYQYFAIMDEGHIKALNDYYKEENLSLMKEILKLLILEDYAALHTSPYYAQILANTTSKLIGAAVGADRLLEYYEYEQLKPEKMGSYLNIKYDEKYFTEAEKQEMREFINKIKLQYREVIKNSDWLDDATKEGALKKLDNMKVSVGYTKTDEEESTVKIVSKTDGGSLVAADILLRQEDSVNFSKKLRKPHHETLSQFLANAYYNPQENSINFLSGFREIYRGIDNKYERYAYAGMIIAHEMSHAFDNNGSQFDEKGNVKSWWTDNDKNDYDIKKQSIVKYYSNYEMYGMKINGELTVGENIADLGAVKTILSVMESENATNDDYKEFFEAYAKLWNDSYSKEIIEQLILTDEHSPNKIRVNAVLSSMDKFYEVYDIKEGDGMYVAKENRVNFW